MMNTKKHDSTGAYKNIEPPILHLLVRAENARGREITDLRAHFSNTRGLQHLLELLRANGWRIVSVRRVQTWG